MNYIHANAKLGKNVTVGPFSCISEHVEIGEGTKIESNVVIMDYVKIGANCHIFPGAVIGAIPQDLKFKGETSRVEIGDNCTIRECVTVNRGTASSGKLKTSIGNNCLIMSYSHIAHDCMIGNSVVMASFTGLAGETDIDDYAILGGKTGTHQFSRIGTHVMTMGGSLVGKDIPPYIIAGHLPLSFGGVNRIGLRRRGFSIQKIEEISSIYKVIYQGNMNTTDACNRVEQEFAQTDERDLILNFIRTSKRGIVRRSINLADVDAF
ncbi:MAG: acyl-ACP--UDP-N-acetylglucosamine O-acyltransferase [Prevotellaceae bacterium]|jgi:UDP-N-acetylglucosamine acyltransferase|nr:acyl-ACP--UDP-N-acetylglucosamine O-acyltransferase [Prevotellaceae bacterium]